MTIFLFSVLVFIASICAGLIGSLTGLGGGVVIIPALVLFFHINIHYAMGASLIAVVATSSGTAAAYLRKGFTNIRIGMFLEVAAVAGALIGALLIPYISKTILTLLFCGLLFLSAFLTIKRHEDQEVYTSSHPWGYTLQLNDSYPTYQGNQSYYVQHVPFAFFIMWLAGMISGLLGIGSGTLKVLAMDQVMRLPYKVSTTTSNFMIGITAAVSAGVYFTHGYIHPIIVMPVMLGVIVGAHIGARLLPHLHTQFLRILFSIIISLMGIQMLINSFSASI